MALDVEMAGESISPIGAVIVQPLMDGDVLAARVFSAESYITLTASSTQYIVLDFSAVTGTVIVKEPGISADAGPIEVVAAASPVYSGGTTGNTICRYFGKPDSLAILSVNPTVTDIGDTILEAIIPAGGGRGGGSSNAEVSTSQPYVIPEGGSVAVKLSNLSTESAAYISYALVWDELGIDAI